MILRLTSDLAVDPTAVESLAWRRRDYMNCSGDSTLIITMVSGDKHEVRHNPGPYGPNAYEIERSIIDAADAAAGVTA